MENFLQTFKQLLLSVDNLNRGKELAFNDLLKKIQTADAELCKVLSNKNLTNLQKTQYLKSVSNLVDDMRQIFSKGLLNKSIKEPRIIGKNLTALNKMLSSQSLNTKNALPFRSILRDYAAHLQHKELIVCGLYEIDQAVLKATNYNDSALIKSGKRKLAHSTSHIPSTKYDEFENAFLNKTGGTNSKQITRHKYVYSFFAERNAGVISDTVAKQVYFDQNIMGKYQNAYTQYQKQIKTAAKNIAELATGSKPMIKVNFTELAKITPKDLLPVNANHARALDEFRGHFREICSSNEKGLMPLFTKGGMPNTRSEKLIGIVTGYENMIKNNTSINKDIHFVGTNSYDYRNEVHEINSTTKKQKLSARGSFKTVLKKRSLGKAIGQVFSRGLLGPEIAAIETAHLAAYASVLSVVFTAKFFAKQLGYTEAPSEYGYSYYHYKKDHLRGMKSFKKLLIASDKNSLVVSQKTKFLEDTINVKDAAIEMAQLDIDTIHFAELYELKPTKYGTYTSDTSALALSDLQNSQSRIKTIKSQIGFLEDAKLYNYKADTLSDLDNRDNPNDTVETLQAKIVKHQEIIAAAEHHLAQHQKLLARVNLQYKMADLTELANSSKKTKLTGSVNKLR